MQAHHLRKCVRRLWALVFLVAIAPIALAQPGQIPQIPAFLPMAHTVPKAQPMPIDGTWTISSLGKRIRIEGGRAYAVDPWVHLFVLKIQPSMVVIKDIKPTGPGRYSGQDLPLMGQFDATVQADGSLGVSVAAIVPARYTLVPVTLDNQAWFNQEMQAAGLTPAQPAGYQPAPPQGRLPTCAATGWLSARAATGRLSAGAAAGESKPGLPAAWLPAAESGLSTTQPRLSATGSGLSTTARLPTPTDHSARSDSSTRSGARTQRGLPSGVAGQYANPE